MSQPLSIRTATIADIGLIRQLAEATWPEAYGEIISDEQISYMLNLIYNDEALLDQMKKGHAFYIAEFNGTAVGFASVSEEGSEGCKLNKLYVLPAIQKTGAGKALLEQAINYTRLKKHNRLFLQVNKANKAKDFYTKMGFTIEKEYILDIGNGFVMDDYIMEYFISD